MRSAAHPQGPALRRGEPLADQVGQRVDGEAIGEQSPFGAAAWTAGEELQHLALFGTEAHGRQVFSKRSRRSADRTRPRPPAWQNKGPRSRSRHGA
jgi:hypothetical protein